MKDLTSRKRDGIISLVWFVFGFAVLVLGELIGFPASLSICCFLFWCAGTLLFVLSGLRSNRPANTWCSALAIALLLLLLFHIRPRIGHGAGQLTAAHTQLANFKIALDSFRVDTGSYPLGTNGLRALVVAPPTTTNWHGPYMDRIPQDPWGHDYIYQYPGQHTNSGYPYDLYSQGPPGGNLPIQNWTSPIFKP